jgi:hypothetical protein
MKGKRSMMKKMIMSFEDSDGERREVEVIVELLVVRALKSGVLLSISTSSQKLF